MDGIGIRRNEMRFMMMQRGVESGKDVIGNCTKCNYRALVSICLVLVMVLLEWNIYKVCLSRGNTDQACFLEHMNEKNWAALNPS